MTDVAAVSWSESSKRIDVEIRSVLRDEMDDLVVVIGVDSLRVACGGVALCDGRLAGRVVLDGSFWTRYGRTVAITLEKDTAGIWADVWRGE